MSPRRLPLEGIRVADFTWIGAGSFTTRALADLGADVIKIESVLRLDSLRESKPFKDAIPGINRSGYFSERNASKRSITLNLKDERGQALARQLIESSDIVANNFTPGTMEKFGLGYESVRAFHPGVVYLAMSMQGSDGPESRYLGYGLTMGALTGLHNLCGFRDREPAGTGTNYPDHIPNPMHAAFAVLVAMWHRRRTGVGQYIDLAQIEPTIALLGPAVMDYTVNGHVVDRNGNQHVAAVPYGVFPCAGEDRWIAIAATTNAQWRSLVEVLEAHTLASDRQLDSAPLRWLQRERIDRELAIHTAAWQGDELMRRLQACGVGAGVVNDPSNVLYDDPQLAERGQWNYLDHPEMGRCAYASSPVRLSGEAVRPRAPAPLLGQHTREVCRDALGLSDAQIDALEAEGVLR